MSRWGGRAGGCGGDTLVPTRDAQHHVPRRRPPVPIDDLEAEPVGAAVPRCHPLQLQGAVPGAGVPEEPRAAPKVGVHLLPPRVVHQCLPALVVLVPDGHDAIVRCHLLGVAQGAGNHQAGPPDAPQGLGVGDPPGAKGCVGEGQREGGSECSPLSPGDPAGLRNPPELPNRQGGAGGRGGRAERAGRTLNPPAENFAVVKGEMMGKVRLVGAASRQHVAPAALGKKRPK